MTISVYLIQPDDSPFFYAQWVVPVTGKRKTRSLRTSDPREAEKARVALEYKLNHVQGFDEALMDVSWSDFVGRFVAERLGDASPGGQRNVRRNLARFGRSQKPAGPRCVTTDMISRHTAALRQAELAPATIQTHLAHLGTALRWAVRMGMAERLPHIDQVKVPKKRNIRHVKPEQFPALLAICPTPQWTLFCRVAWHTGMRCGELFLLRWDQGDGPYFDLIQQRIRFPAEYCKSRKDDWLPIHKELLPLLLEQKRDQGRVFDLAPDPRELSAKFCRMAKPLGIMTHDLRRSFGTRYAPLVPAHVLQRLMRHANISTTLEYYADLDPALDAAINLA